jgi:hypothetical protein
MAATKSAHVVVVVGWGVGGGGEGGHGPGRRLAADWSMPAFPIRAKYAYIKAWTCMHSKVRQLTEDHVVAFACAYRKVHADKPDARR